MEKYLDYIYNYKKLFGRIGYSCQKVLFVFFLIIAVSLLALCKVPEKKEKTYYPEDFTSIQGVEIYRPSQMNRNRYLRQATGIEKCIAGRHYYGTAFRYTIALTASQLSPGAQEVMLLINEQEVGLFALPAEPNEKEMTGNKLIKEVYGINIPQYSKIDLQFSETNRQAWGVESLILIPEGKYQGETVSLPKPQTLRVYNAIKEQNEGHSMLERFVQENVAREVAKRDSVLSALSTQEDFRAYQADVRKRLPSIFGPFPEKTPLNPRVVGRVDFPDYYMEKIIYESQPGLYIPANLYVPKNREFPVPGILFTFGHTEFGKQAPDYNALTKGLAKKGYVVLASEPIGQGERREYFDPETLECIVCRAVNEHHYVGNPAFLADWSLSTIRTWDCIRAIDYLVSRSEVDPERLGVTGNSGGGQMATIIGAIDERIKVIAAAHPGGSMEATYPGGRDLPNMDLLTLIPPRPCRIIVGDASGEAPGHQRKLDEMIPFYKAFGISEDHWDMEIVEGRHDNSLAKREPVYEWMNLWFDKTEEGEKEPEIEKTDAETHWCTETGLVLASLGGETGQTLNQKRGERIYQKVQNLDELKERVRNRIHLEIPDNAGMPETEMKEKFTLNDISVEKFVYVPEPGITVPALLFRPSNNEKKEIIIHVSAEGKPDNLDKPTLPFLLAKEGYPVLSIDVRGTGETANYPPPAEPDVHYGYSVNQFQRNIMAVKAALFDRSMLGMRTLDVIKAIDLVSGRRDLKNNRITVIGEGLGGLWATLGSAWRPEVQAVITVNTLPSYNILLSAKYYTQRDYFWVPGALRDFDIPDLGRLVAPRKQLWIDPVNAMTEKMNTGEAAHIMSDIDNLRVVGTAGGQKDEISKEIIDLLKN